MKGFVVNIETVSRENEFFRRVLYTTRLAQVVVMSLRPGEDIGAEVHTLDQFIRCESGVGTSVLGDVEHELSAGHAVLVPAGMRHNIINTSPVDALKLSTLYSPPNHRDGVVHMTKVAAEADHEQFDGTTSEPE